MLFAMPPLLIEWFNLVDFDGVKSARKIKVSIEHLYSINI